jgi:hypothetical protein
LWCWCVVWYYEKIKISVAIATESEHDRSAAWEVRRRCGKRSSVLATGGASVGV